VVERADGGREKQDKTMKLIRTNIKTHGFSLVEILAVMVIAAILLALVLGLYGRVKSKQVESRLQAEMAAIELALENYKSKNGQYPSSASWDGFSYPRKAWSEAVPDTVNLLYKHLCQNEGKAFLPDVKESQTHKDVASGDMTGSLTGSVPGGNKVTIKDANGAITSEYLENAKWHYNSRRPVHNKNTYDLWIEYNDDGVKVISNWSN